MIDPLKSNEVQSLAFLAAVISTKLTKAYPAGKALTLLICPKAEKN
jgi:hypothetical protein